MHNESTRFSHTSQKNEASHLRFHTQTWNLKGFGAFLDLDSFFSFGSKIESPQKCSKNSQDSGPFALHWAVSLLPLWPSSYWSLGAQTSTRLLELKYLRPRGFWLSYPEAMKLWITNMLHASMDEDISSHGNLSFICVCTVFRYIYCIYIYTYIYYAHIYIYIQVCICQVYLYIYM